MLPSADPGVRLRLVLNEFLIRGEKVWVQLDVTDYDNPLYANFYVDLGKMILTFRAHGKLPRGIRLGQVNDCISQCLPNERV
jgi:hypothetical protein